jgi:hypothetical protein
VATTKLCLTWINYGHLLTEVPKLVLRKYDAGTPTAVDVLLVLPNDSKTLPIRFKAQIGQYKAGTIWVRQSHEVVEAEPRHISLLYCRSRSNEDTVETLPIDGGLPPSPATIKRFVGRMATIDNIFRWLKLSDEPRTFLYGKGGSGKTTIAYEVAKAVRDEGANIQIFGNEKLDTVIFVISSRGQNQRLVALSAGSGRAFLARPQLVQPEAILRWHRAGFKMFWRWKSRNRVGRPKIDRRLRDLIRRRIDDNDLAHASVRDAR